MTDEQLDYLLVHVRAFCLKRVSLPVLVVRCGGDGAQLHALRQTVPHF